jgi:hypothetical protein
VILIVITLIVIVIANNRPIRILYTVAAANVVILGPAAVALVVNVSHQLVDDL